MIDVDDDSVSQVESIMISENLSSYIIYIQQDEPTVSPGAIQKTKKCDSRDLLTIFSDHVKVWFVNGKGEE